MQYNVRPETADYFAKRGITGDLCGPYYAAGVSVEDTVAYLDSGFTADQIMPYVRAGVPGSDVMTYLDAGAPYDRAKPYIDANAPAGAAAPYAAGTFPADQCMPFIDAGIEHHKSTALPALWHTVGPGGRLYREWHFGVDGKTLCRCRSSGR